jgi:hypothetical protein
MHSWAKAENKNKIRRKKKYEKIHTNSFHDIHDIFVAC